MVFTIGVGTWMKKVFKGLQNLLENQKENHRE